MEQIYIKNNIELTPDKLDSNINKYLLEQLKNKFTGTCSKENGYIVDIVKINKIISNTISNTSGNAVFNVECSYNTLKPEIGKVIDFKVIMISSHGIIAMINKLKIFIPCKDLVDYKFNDTDKTYSKRKKTISKDDNIKVKITNIKYMKKEYSCIGVLKE
mgnify:CR=1 FL=1